MTSPAAEAKAIEIVGAFMDTTFEEEADARGLAHQAHGGGSRRGGEGGNRSRCIIRAAG
jgi:hypothetical protein